MSEANIWVALIVGLSAGVPATIASLAAYNQAKGANRAVNGVAKGEPTLINKVDTFVGRVEHAISEQEFMRKDVDALKGHQHETINRLKSVESAAAHISEQAEQAAVLAAQVKSDFDLAHERANAIPPSAPPGVAADAAVQTSEELSSS